MEASRTPTRTLNLLPLDVLRPLGSLAGNIGSIAGSVGSLAGSDGSGEPPAANPAKLHLHRSGGAPGRGSALTLGAAHGGAVLGLVLGLVLLVGRRPAAAGG